MDICICFAGNVACSCKCLPAEQTTSDAFDEGSQSEGCALGDHLIVLTLKTIIFCMPMVMRYAM